MNIESDLRKYWLDHNKDKEELAKFIDSSLMEEEYIELDGIGPKNKAELLIKKWENERSADYLLLDGYIAHDKSEALIKEWEVFNIENSTVGKAYNDLFESAKEAQQVYQESKHKGLRFNEGKLRYDLVHPWSQEQMVRVLTKGSVKYEERNWERGMKWSNVLASAKRHMAAIERGEDYDIDPNCSECQKSTKDNWVCKNHTGELHAALLQTNAHFLTAYYKIYPQGDDRPKPYLSHKKIGLDIDDVLADFVGAWLKRYPQNKPNFWNFDKDFGEKYEAIKNDKEFWMNIEPKIDPSELLFEPTCYITSRGVPSEWTEEWLQRNGFPAVPVYTVGLGESKVEIAKQSGIDIFVDDRFENFVELNNAGICTFLMDANHNKRYDVQARRIYSLKDLV